MAKDRIARRKNSIRAGCLFEVDGFFLSHGFYSEVDALEGCTKPLKNPRWRAREARAPARMFALFLFGFFFQKSVKTAVPDAGNPLGTLVFTKLVE